MYRYPVNLTSDDNGTVMVTFPDVPEAVTFGEDAADALARAPDALETALAGYIEDRRDIPVPSQNSRLTVVDLSLLAALKLQIYTAMRDRQWRKADLARAMTVNPRQIDRLLDLHHATPVSQLDAAFLVCGRRVIIEAIAA